jgi:hypothetical protein
MGEMIMVRRIEFGKKKKREKSIELRYVHSNGMIW